MATVNHTYFKNLQNYPTANSGNAANGLWALSRIVKKGGYKYKASGDNSTKDVTGDPELDKWNITPGSIGPVSNAGGAGQAVVAAPSRGRATVTGLSGIVAADKGRFLKITGSGSAANNHAHQIEEVLSATSVKIDARTFTVVADATPRTWEIRDPILDIPNFNGKAGWWLGQGPSILKIPFTVSPTTDFSRGENIVQAVTGAEAQVISVFYENGAGYIVATPRVRGTGGEPYGWATGNIVSGTSASITQNGTCKQYIMELCLFKSGDALAAINVGFFDYSVDSGWAQTTAWLTSAGAGSPGASQTYSWCAFGTGMTGASQFSKTQSTNVGNCQGMCADCIEESGYSADGSWAVVIAGTTENAYFVRHFGWFDDPENGDLCPFYTTCGTSQTVAIATMATVGKDSVGATPNNTNTDARMVLYDSEDVQYIRSWRRRGLSGDGIIMSKLGIVQFPGPNSAGGQGAIRDWYTISPAERFNLSIPASTVRMLVKMPVWNMFTAAKVIKGNTRWLRVTIGGTVNNVYTESPSKVFLQLHTDPATGDGPWVIGPWLGGVDAVITG